MRSLVNSNLEYRPVTKDRWADFEELFGKSGAYGGCWCMWWRSKRSEFETRGNAGNRVAMKDIIEAYPTLPKEHRLPPVSSFMGIPSMYEKEGFVEVARPSESKVVMRYTIS